MIPPDRRHVGPLRMQGLDQAIDLRCHHTKNPYVRLTHGGERMHRARAYDVELSSREPVPLVAIANLELAFEHAEGLVTAMMHMQWRLVSGIRRQSPLTDHEVRHSRNDRRRPAAATLG